MTAPAPSACPTCHGTGLVAAMTNDPSVLTTRLCPDCHCPICWRPTAAIGGECGDCWTDEDAAAVRREDR